MLLGNLGEIRAAGPCVEVIATVVPRRRTSAPVVQNFSAKGCSPVSIVPPTPCAMTTIGLPAELRSLSFCETSRQPGHSSPDDGNSTSSMLYVVIDAGALLSAHADARHAIHRRPHLRTE